MARKEILPAAMVSPPRLSRMRPISLFTANGSSGIDTARAFELELELRSVIVTLAELALGNTLPDPHISDHTYSD